MLEKELSKEKILGCVIMTAEKETFHYYKNRKIPNRDHKINSCTKSILSALFGIARGKGHFQDLHEPVAKYFPKEMNLLDDHRKKELTIFHLLTMSTGLHFPEWEEWNGFAPMAQGGDINQFVLSRDLILDPGEKMTYNSGCSHLLTCILQETVGETALEFASRELFAPLGIKKPVWYSDSKGINKGADGLRLTIEDMLRIGTLYLQEGKWKGKQLIPEEWIRESLKPRYLTYEHIGYYGFHWWTAKINENEDPIPSNTFHFALGHGGQYILIVPSMDLVCVFVSELYQTSSLIPLRLFREFILNQE